MPTASQLRKMALALPETEESSHMGHADFRVGGKIFGGLSEDAKRASLRLSPEIQASLPLDDEVFAPCPGAWGRQGWTYVVLARVDAGVLRDLVFEAWRHRAPKRVVDAHAGGAPSTAPPPERTRKTTKNPKTRARTR